MFIPDDTFKTKIFRELEGGDKSISTLHRALTDQGFKVHRLVLTGYLKAMEEMGVLSSKEFPPSRVYSVSSVPDRDIYGTLQEIIAGSTSQEKRPEMTLFVLQKLFRRPVFRSEMERSGIAADPEAFAVKISNEERLELKKNLAKRGIKLNLKEQAYVLKGKDFSGEFDEVLQQALLHKFRAGNLVVDTKQTKLV